VFIVDCGGMFLLQCCRTDELITLTFVQQVWGENHLLLWFTRRLHWVVVHYLAYAHGLGGTKHCVDEVLIVQVVQVEYQLTYRLENWATHFMKIIVHWYWSWMSLSMKTASLTVYSFHTWNLTHLWNQMYVYHTIIHLISFMYVSAN
jgi:hypothetical protein